MFGMSAGVYYRDCQTMHPKRQEYAPPQAPESASFSGLSAASSMSGPVARAVCGRTLGPQLGLQGLAELASRTLGIEREHDTSTLQYGAETF